MYPLIEIPLFILLIVFSIIAISSKDLLTAVVILSGFSFITALLYLTMGAVDVSFTEAVVGSGISGVLMTVLIFRTQRRSFD